MKHNPILLAMLAQALCDAASPPRPRKNRALEPLEANPPGLEWLAADDGGGWACCQLGLDHEYVMTAARRAKRIGKPLKFESVIRILGEIGDFGAV
jgi:hypothetical protein